MVREVTLATDKRGGRPDATFKKELETVFVRIAFCPLRLSWRRPTHLFGDICTMMTRRYRVCKRETGPW